MELDVWAYLLICKAVEKLPCRLPVEFFGKKLGAVPFMNVYHIPAK